MIYRKEQQVNKQWMKRKYELSQFFFENIPELQSDLKCWDLNLFSSLQLTSFEPVQVMPTPATKGKLDATNPTVISVKQKTKQDTVNVIDEGAVSMLGR